MSMKLYVGNLSYDVDNAQLEDMFSEYGTVKSAQVIQDRETRRSKGFGFVEMADDNAAREATQGLNGSDKGGRPLTVNEARPQEARSGGSDRGSYSRR
jgi:cold-inducible RNA-binding protein